MSDKDACRRWTIAISQLKSRAAKMRRNGAPQETADLMEQSLSLCDAIVRDLAGAGLQLDESRVKLDAQVALWTHLFDEMPTACVETDASGVILGANPAAAVLFNTSVKHLTARLLMHFAEDRDQFGQLLRGLSVESGRHRCALISARASVHPCTCTPLWPAAVPATSRRGSGSSHRSNTTSLRPAVIAERQSRPPARPPAFPADSRSLPRRSAQREGGLVCRPALLVEFRIHQSPDSPDVTTNGALVAVLTAATLHAQELGWPANGRDPEGTRYLPAASLHARTSTGWRSPGPIGPVKRTRALRHASLPPSKPPLSSSRGRCTSARRSGG